MEKRGLFLLPFLSAISCVSADTVTDSLANGSYNLAYVFISAFGPFFYALLGGSPDMLFEEILLFFIITSIVYMTIRNMDLFKGNKAIVLIVTFSVSLLATRFSLWSDFLINTVILPYSVLGVAISAFVPLIIGFFFVQSFNSGFLRKTFWIFFIVVFWAMWELRYEDVGSISWIYFWSAVIALLFFLFDGTIRRALIKQKMVESNITSHEEFGRRIRRELEQLEQDKLKNIVSDSEYYKIKSRLNKQLRELLKF